MKVEEGVPFKAGEHNAAQYINAQNIILEKIDFCSVQILLISLVLSSY